MQKQLKRTLSLLLLLALLLGIIPTGSAFRAYAAETETVAAETEETTEVSAAAEEPTPESEEETEPSEESTPEEESKPAEENETPREIDPCEGEATGTIVELEQIRARDEVLASSYGLQIPVILYGAGNAFTVSFRYPNDTSQTTYTIKLTGFRYHYLNGQMAYCLEPQAESTPSAVYSQIAGGAELNVWDQFLSDSQRNAISLVLAYGAPNALNSSTKLTLHGYEAATQVLIWEIIVGYRSATKPYACSNAGLYNFVLNLCNPNDNTGTLRAAYISGYDSILSAMANHELIPSFTSKKLSQAPTHEMTYDATTGLYKVVLTDTNNAINNDFPFTNGNGLTFAKSGNTLTVTATATALQNADLTVSTKGKILDTENASPVIWGTSNSNHHQGQILSQMANPDPVPCYFKLTANTTTNLSIQKVCADGKVGGIKFTVTDSSGNVLFSGQTDPSGKLNVPDLEIGSTVTVTETVPDNYVAENRTQTVTLKAGPNNVTFRNIPLGTAAMNKVSEGGDVEGYCFNLYRFKKGSTSDRTWRGKSDSDGRVYETDANYHATGTEKNYVFKGLTDGTYAFREVLSLHGAGNVWPESITFATSGGTTPACTLIFTGEQLVSHENGDCTVSGIALTGLDGGGTLTVTRLPVHVHFVILVFDIHDLGAQLKPTGLLVITDTILNRATLNWKRGKRTHIFIDEFHVLYSNEHSANFFDSAWRMFRKRNAYPTAITQNVEYLLDSVQASTMLSNSEFVVMLNQAASDRMRLAELLNISKEQLSYITNADAGCGLIRYGSALVPFINRFPKDTKMYQLMTTRPGEGSFAGGHAS